MPNLTNLFRQWARGWFKSIAVCLFWLKKHPLQIVYGILLIILMLITVFIFRTQMPFSVILVGDKNEHLVNKPVIINFSQTINDDFNFDIRPPVKGRIQKVNGIFGTRQVIFNPDQQLPAGTEYNVKLTNLRRVTGQNLADVELTFMTENPPKIINFEPQNASNNILPNADIVLELDRGNNNLRKFVVHTNPAIKLVETVEQQGKIYRWHPDNSLQQGNTYEVKVYDELSANPDQPIIINNFKIVSEPQVLSATTNDHFYPGQTIDIEFNTEMKQTEPGMVCECQGDGKWIDDKHYKFTPNNIEVAKTYAYKVPAGLSSMAGGAVEADKTYEFKTPGNVVASFVPLGNSAPTNSKIAVSFDQVVDKASAEQRFSINPNVSGNFSWPNSNTMVFTPDGLGQQVNYTATLAPGVKPVQFGLESVNSFSMGFRTVIPSVKLNVPVYRQQYRASCEASALRMALAYRGINADDFSITQRMGYNGQPMNRDANSWDDPFEMFVGDINGLQSSYIGYGVYAPPIAKAAQSYGRDAKVFYGVSAEFIAQQIYDGNPVVITGTINGATPQYFSWNGPNGLVHAWLGEHARVVIGVTGTPAEPVSFIVNDPSLGTQQTWSPGRLMNDINAIPQLASQVVVVY